MRAAIFGVTALCMFAASADATTILALRTPEAVVLGADSMVIREKIMQGDNASAGMACKIGVAGNVFWGESGLLRSGRRNFSVDQIAASSMSTGEPLNIRVTNFEIAIVPELTAILNDLKNSNSPDWFHHKFEDQSALEIVFCAFENGIPRLYQRDFVVKSDPASGIIEIHIDRTDAPSAKFPESMLAILGRHEAVAREISYNPSLGQQFGLAGVIRHLIETEIAAAPEEVGPPIALIEITSDGPHWISRGQCAP